MSLERVEHCPICANNTFQPFLVCKDYTTTGELFHVEQCTQCGMVITNPRPTQEKASTYYQSSQYISHNTIATGLFDSIYLVVRRFTLRWKRRLVNPYLNGNLLLDVGCGTGSFLHHCKQSGLEVYGVEPSDDARAKALGYDLRIVESIEKLPHVQFDVITLWHVLEHMYELNASLEKIKDRLADNGIIFIAVPNWQSPDASHYHENWAGYDVPRHVWHFSKAAMEMVLKNSGLKLKKIIPMMLDAFYVSLLSEKNAGHGKLSILKAMKAIRNGYQSNLKAKRGMNYSSLIYLVQK